MTKLAKWHVEEILENFVLGGFPVKDDDRFLACSSILTSMIDTVEVDEPNKAFIFHTMSGSEYLCPFEDIRWTDRFAEFSKDNLERLKVVPHFVDEAIKLAHEKESSFVAWLEKEIFNGDLFIEIGAGGILNVHFKYEDKVHRLSNQIHMGMFKDSYLYQLSGIVDFRHYEFIGGSVNTYHMSDSIKRLVVNNIGSRPVTIGNVVYRHGVICDKKIFAKTLLKERLRSRRLAIMLIDFMKDKSVRLSKINSTKNPDTRLLFDDLPSVADDVKRTFYLIIDIDETIRSERDIVDYCIYGGWINKEFVEVLGKEEALPIFEDLIPFILREEMILCG